MVRGPQRLVITGGPGSGKSHLAGVLAARLAIPHVELDALFHGPNWTPADPGEFRAAVDALTLTPAWIVDGNYQSKVGDLVLTRADLIVALDLPRPVVFVRLVQRTLTRMIAGTELWNGNREDWRNLFSLDQDQNLLLYAHRHFRDYRRLARARQAASRDSGPAAVRLTSPAQVVRFAQYLTDLAAS